MDPPPPEGSTGAISSAQVLVHSMRALQQDHTVFNQALLNTHAHQIFLAHVPLGVCATRLGVCATPSTIAVG